MHNKLLLTAKSSYKKTAEIRMKTAADEVRCLVAEEKHDAVSENSNIRGRRQFSFVPINSQLAVTELNLHGCVHFE